MTNFIFPLSMENKCRNENTNTYITSHSHYRWLYIHGSHLKTWWAQTFAYDLSQSWLFAGCVCLKETFKCICSAWFWLWRMNRAHTHRHMHMFVSVTGHSLRLWNKKQRKEKHKISKRIIWIMESSGSRPSRIDRDTSCPLLFVWRLKSQIIYLFYLSNN